MPRVSLRRWAIAGVGVALVALLLDPGTGLDRRPARADRAPAPAQDLETDRASRPPTVAIVGTGRPFPRRDAAGQRVEGRLEGSGGWWLGTAGIALALAVCGGISLSTRRGWTQAHAAGALRVVGRTSLTPRHTVHLLRVGGGRVLIVGTGPQGAPSLLGELTDSDVPPQSDSSAHEAGSSLLDRLVATRRRPAGEGR